MNLPLTEEEVEKILPKKKQLKIISSTATKMTKEDGETIDEGFYWTPEQINIYNQAIDDCKSALIGKCGNVQLSEKDLEEFLRNVFKIEYNGNVYFNRKPFNFVSDWFEVTRKEIYGIIAKALSQKLATPTFSGGGKEKL